VLTPSRLRELQCDHGGAGRYRHQLEQAVGRLDLAVFDLQSLFLQYSEYSEILFDDPARTVPIDDLPSHCGVGHRMGGQEMPNDRFGAFRLGSVSSIRVRVTWSGRPAFGTERGRGMVIDPTRNSRLATRSGRSRRSRMVIASWREPASPRLPWSMCGRRPGCDPDRRARAHAFWRSGPTPTSHRYRPPNRRPS
jgi:hypothetical protein